MSEVIEARRIRKAKTMPLPERHDPTCRICLEPSEVKDLISPCKCIGSVSHVHEECLKTWVTSKSLSLEEAKCEICHVKFQMMWESGHACIFHKLMTQNFGKFVVVPILVVLEFMLIVLMSILVDNIASTESSKKKVFSSILIVICCLIFTCLLVVIAFAIKNLYFIKQIKNWSIYNYQELRDLDEVENEKFSKTIQFEPQPPMNFQVLPIDEEHIPTPPKLSKRNRAKTVKFLDKDEVIEYSEE